MRHLRMMRPEPDRFPAGVRRRTMTPKNRNLIVSAAALAALVLTFVITRFTKPDEVSTAAPAAAENTKLADTASDELRLIATEYPGGGVTLSSADGDEWAVRDLPEGFRLDDTRLQSMVRNLSNIEGRLIEENAGDPAPYGLAEPAARVRLEDMQGITATILIGDENPSGTGRYAASGDSGDDADVYLVPSFRASAALWSLGDLRDADLPRIAMDQLSGFLIQSGGKRLTARTAEGDPAGEADALRPPAAGMILTEPWAAPRPVDNYQLQEHLTASPPPTRITEFLDAQPVSVSAAGLGQGADRIRLEDAEGGVYDLEIGGSAGEGRRYAREMSNPDLVFLVDPADLELLNTRAFTVSDKFVYLAGIDRLAEAEIRGGGSGYTLSIERRGDPEDDSDDLYMVDGREIPEDDFKDAYQALIGLLYEGTADEPSKTGGAPKFVIRYSPMDTGFEDVVVSFFDHDEVYFTASVDGGEREFLIGRYQLDNAVQAVERALAGG